MSCGVMESSLPGVLQEKLLENKLLLGLNSFLSVSRKKEWKNSTNLTKQNKQITTPFQTLII